MIAMIVMIVKVIVMSVVPVREQNNEGMRAWWLMRLSRSCVA